MAQLQLSDLLQPQTSQQVFDKLIALYQSAGFPVSAWQLGGMERTRLAAFSTIVADTVSNWIPILASSGLVDFAQSLPGNWLALLAQEQYNLSQKQPTFADGYILLSNSTGANISVAASQLLVKFPSGNRYRNLIGGVVPSGSTLSLPFQSEFQQNTPGGLNYNQDGTNAAGLVLVTPIPGITISNPPSTFSTPTHTGASLGTLTPTGSSGGSFHYIIVKVLTSGNITNSTASFEYSLDGASYLTLPTPVFFAVPNTGSPGINIALSDNGFGAFATTFYAGDTFQFQTPGSWQYQQGIDTETNPALALRCKNRWNTLSQVPTTGFYEFVIQQSSSPAFPVVNGTPTLGSQATNVLVLTDGYVNNKVNIIVAGPNGPLPPAVIADMQTYVNTYAPITDLPVVGTPTPQAITISGNITYSVALNAPTQSIIQLDEVNPGLIDYIQSVGINSTIKLAEITQIIMNANGVLNVVNLAINGFAADLTLGNINSFVIPTITTASLNSNLTYTAGN